VPVARRWRSARRRARSGSSKDARAARLARPLDDRRVSAGAGGSAGSRTMRLSAGGESSAARRAASCGAVRLAWAAGTARRTASRTRMMGVARGFIALSRL